jgi:hypothetical protein
MVSVLTQAGSAMYEQAAASNAGGAEDGGSASSGGGSDDDETVDAEFREVGGEDKA